MGSLWTAWKALTLWQKVASVAIPFLLIAGCFALTYKLGYEKGIHISELEIKNYEKQVAELNAKKAQVQTQIVEKVVVEYRDRVQQVEKVVYRNIEVPVPAQYNLSKGWVYTHNQTAKGLLADPVLASDPTPSDVADAEALQGTIIPNYGICLNWRNQVLAWQKWYDETLKNYEGK